MSNRFGIAQARFYRFWIKNKTLISFEAKVKETDLYIRASKDLQREAIDLIKRHRKPIEDFIGLNPAFEKTLVPYPLSIDMEPIIKDMVVATKKVNVGPMAAVAGAIAEYVGYDLLGQCEEVIVENGGDIFIKVKRPIKIGIYAADSPFTQRLVLKIEPEETPIGVCTSSGIVGPSLSFGLADAAIALSKSTSLADACATAIGNLIKTEDDIPKALEYAKGIDGLYGVVLIKGKKMGAWGNVKFLR
ncbi:MAG: UPF0280 family protein [Candidatus Omnitrophica bacterium]|nr:UPF0280 family protein [Candidatus Omnitrophota bacterium]